MATASGIGSAIGAVGSIAGKFAGGGGGGQQQQPGFGFGTLPGTYIPAPQAAMFAGDLQANAAMMAGQLATENFEKAIDELRRTEELSRADFAPFRFAGLNALTQAADLIGLPRPTVGFAEYASDASLQARQVSDLRERETEISNEIDRLQLVGPQFENELYGTGELASNNIRQARQSLISRYQQQYPDLDFSTLDNEESYTMIRPDVAGAAAGIQEQVDDRIADLQVRLEDLQSGDLGRQELALQGDLDDLRIQRARLGNTEGVTDEELDALDERIQGVSTELETIQDQDPLNFGNVPQTVTDPTEQLAALQQTPGYQFRLQQGLDAIQRSQASRGLLESGGAAKELQQFGEGMAAQEFGAAYDRLAGLVQTGAGVTSQQNQLATQLGSQRAVTQGQIGEAQAQAELAKGQALAQAQLTAGLEFRPTGILTQLNPQTGEAKGIAGPEGFSKFF